MYCGFMSVVNVIIVIAMVVGLIQYVPLITPRIGDADIEYLHVQNSNLEYYMIGRLTYSVEPPLLLLLNKATLPLPENIEIYGKFSNLQQSNPYSDIILSNTENFVTSEKLNGRLKIKLLADGISIKSFKTNIYFRTKTNIECTNPDSDGFWWTELNGTTPKLQIRVECHQNSFMIGGVNHGKDREVSFLFQKYTVKNRGNLPIGNFLAPLDDSPRSALRVCDEDREMEIRQFENKRYVPLNLDVGEEKNLIIVRQLGVGEATEEFGIIYNINVTHSGCAGGWRNDLNMFLQS